MMLVPIAIGAILMKKMVTSILGFFHFRPTLIFGTAMVGIIIFILAFINLKDQPWLLAFLLFLFGLANSLRFTAMSTVTLADLYGPQTSSGNTILSVTQQLAITFGVAIGALLVRIFDTQNPFLEPTLINSFKVSFVILGIITFISGFIFLKLHPEDGANLLKKRSQNR